MVRLYLLGFTHDLKGVVFSQRRAGKKATFWVPIDDPFLRAVDKLQRARREREGSKAATKAGRSSDVVDINDLPARARILPPVGRSQARSGLPASEIQQMLREGRSVKTVAATAKTPLAWVERLAEPVITERIGVVRLAQRAYMLRPRLGTAGLQLGDAVRRNLEERRATSDTIEALDDAWDAKAGASGTWRVWVRFSHRGKRRTAEWEFRKGSRQIVPRNRLGAQLGWWEPEEPPVPELPAAAEIEAVEAAEETPKPRRSRRPKPKTRRPTRPKTKAARSRSARAPARKKPAKRGSRRPVSRRKR
jgi:hypothetical protein